MPIDRAEPSTIRIAASTSRGVQILELLLGDRAHLIAASPGRQARGRASATPFGKPAAFFRKCDTGGVFISKVKLRSA